MLQSLTAIDLDGGRIVGAGYNSTTPLEQQLRALPLELGEDPTAVDFYNAIRGARVEVRAGAVTATGRLLKIEVLDSGAQEVRLVTVISETGEVKTLSLTPTTSVQLLDSDLHKDVTRYLELLAGTRNKGLRHLTLLDNAPATGGAGGRDLRVSYISEVPVWKSTYRILFTDSKASGVQPVTLQGWSVVDNTTGEDWINVQLSLIAGAPQSFIQPLSQPIYSRRPEVAIAEEAQLTPQTHESGETGGRQWDSRHGKGSVGRDGSERDGDCNQCGYKCTGEGNDRRPGQFRVPLAAGGAVPGRGEHAGFSKAGGGRRDGERVADGYAAGNAASGICIGDGYSYRGGCNVEYGEFGDGDDDRRDVRPEPFAYCRGPVW